ncbi:Neutral endopeptidase [Corynebacterium ciconiae DSM 44920]|uniref:M13 family metallopeptidase n=1 Tax=Corynebacterium ciconiae TaxID=227319 RepID=UPI00037D5A2A|nr:M13-type metalloendopeptidase [Corynebacterium ciconiae]WKD60129.1 Neutral endopeptidase [Corynebacterium ciconiae DSM 44920]
MKLHDLFDLVNGEWIDSTTIPADRGIYGAFHELRDRAEDDVRALIAGGDSRASALYSSFMDTEGINQAGVAPIAPLIDAISQAIQPATAGAEAGVDKTRFAQAAGQLYREGVPSLIGCYMAKDAGSENVVAWADQSGLGLPNEAYYREDAHAAVRDAYEQHVATMLELAGIVDADAAAAAAERIVALETRIASGHRDVVASRDAQKSYNPVAVSELPEFSREFLLASGLSPESTVVMRNKDYPEFIDSLLDEVAVEDLRLWASRHVVSSFASMLPTELEVENFRFYNGVLQGSTEQLPRWRRAVSFADSAVSEEIGQLFVQEHFPPEYKAEMERLVDYLLGAYRERISQLEWMTPATRERALEKLGTFKAKIGYPDSWRTYDFEVSSAGADVVANARAATAFEHDYQVAKVGKPADREEWFCPPQMVNAFYYPVQNDITFPAAILRPPFYSPEADAATNFGAIGAVIGHEIGHGFDDQGSRYDGQGSLNDWWSAEDRAAFEKLTAKLVQQFDGQVPSVLAESEEESAGVNGEFTLGENIGDLGGLGIAVVAYRRWLDDQGKTFDTDEKLRVNTEGARPELDVELTGLQRLFVSWARVWRTKIRPELQKTYLAVDPHSPAEFRCNLIAGNVSELYEAFDVDTSSPLYIQPEDRVSIW